ncbi:hypothetical protein GDO81_025709, partial [Engystomops pustulosus]
IEELYETYCIQWRLRVGTCNMKHAFSLSPSTKASRESLVELSKNFQECTEDMCMIEGALEVHLGEFLIKMKGNFHNLPCVKMGASYKTDHLH